MTPLSTMDVIAAPASVTDLALRLALAACLGAAIGLNREISMKPAGLRTHALVCLGAALATLVGLLLTRAPTPDGTAPARIIQGIVAGVGFIGGGVILHRDARTVEGLTTAASIWIVSVAGVAVGAGLWRAATVAIGLSLLVLTLGRRIDLALHRGKGDQVD